jgi:hypothetical protein
MRLFVNSATPSGGVLVYPMLETVRPVLRDCRHQHALGLCIRCAGTSDALASCMSLARRWILRTLPRAALLLTAVAQIISGDIPYGVFCLVAVTLTLVPALHARSLDAGVPIEFELALLWLMVADMTIGNSLGMYRLAYYDKALHLSNSVLIGAIGFLAVYVLHLTQRTRFHPWIDGVAILLVTLGIGALWELAEFGVDTLLGRRSQGAPNMSALDDTMFDLMLDAAGGAIGSVVGPIYIRHSKRSRDRVAAFGQLLKRRETAQRMRL